MTLVCAHRGDSSIYRENTIAAIKSAIEAKADFVEIDVRLTKDNQVIVLHDPTLERMWGRSENSADLTLAQIKALGWEDVRIPLLSEVLPLFDNVHSILLIDMETKEPAAASFEVVSNSLLHQDHVAWCGALEGMKIIRELAPSARIFLPWNESGLPSDELLADLNPEFINLHYSFMSAPRVQTLHDAGYKVSLWTIDDEPTMRWAAAIGVDSITTNYLGLLQETLATNPTLNYAHQTVSVAQIDLDRAEEVARRLGKWAMMVCTFMKPGIVKTKANPADLVTEVDVWIETHVREVIAANFHGHILIGEEEGGEEVSGVPTWYLDPIDGTTNFANGIPWTSMSLALSHDRTPLIGVTIDPWRNELFEARKDRGAKLNGHPLHIPGIEPSENPLAGKVVLTELAAYQPWPGMLKLLEGLAENYCTMRIMGSGTLTLTSIAAGRGVGAVIGHFSPIDHLAAVLIVQEAGGVVLDFEGNVNLFPHSGGIVVASSQASELLMHITSASI